MTKPQLKFNHKKIPKIQRKKRQMGEKEREQSRGEAVKYDPGMAEEELKRGSWETGGSTPQWAEDWAVEDLQRDEIKSKPKKH